MISTNQQLNNRSADPNKNLKIKLWFGMRDDFPVERLYTRKIGSRAISYVASATKRFLLDDPAGSRLQVCANPWYTYRNGIQ